MPKYSFDQQKVEIRRDNYKIRDVYRIVFKGDAIPKEYHPNNAKGFCNYRGWVHAIYEDKEIRYVQLNNDPLPRYLHPLTRSFRNY